MPTKITTYVNCSYWISAGIAAHLTKGSLVELYGRISVNTWTNAEGETKGSLNFHVNNVKIHGKSKSQSEATQARENDPENAKDDLPF